MRASIGLLIACVVLVLGGCASPPAVPGPAASERLAADAPRATVAGNTFIAPAGWTLSVRGRATILEAPEGGSYIAIVDVDAPDGDAALARAWAAYKPDATWPLKSVTPIADRDGWTQRRQFTYQTSPNERRDVEADVRSANGVWTVTISDLAQDVAEKRLAQVGVVYGKFLPKGYTRESFAGRKANRLDAARVADLRAFVARSMQLTKVPGVAVGVYQNGRVVLAEGFGVRELGKPDPVDARTRFIVASNTKALVTLMLARLVDERKMTWDTPAVDLLPSFRLGDASTTRKVLVKHLICACTGMPRQDMEWSLEFAQLTPDRVMALLGTMQPTSDFGQLFQYSNAMAAAAGYIGGHVVAPDAELGAAYDRAMQRYVFDPLGMRATTHDFALAQRGDFATAHAPDMEGHMALAEARENLAVVPLRPAGGAWSTVDDMLKYVAMELAEGALPDGTRYVSREALLARRAPQVAVGQDVAYGMGLIVDTVYGTPVVHHGGDLVGFHSDMMWLPEHDVGAVVLTNADPGWLIRTVFRRKLLEVLFDGRPEADGQIAAQSDAFYKDLAADRKLLAIPADTAASAMLAPRYTNAAVGDVAVRRESGRTVFDFGEFPSEVGSRVNPDGTTSFVTITPGVNGLEFVVGKGGDKRTLTLRDAQHEYVLLERQ